MNVLAHYVLVMLPPALELEVFYSKKGHGCSRAFQVEAMSKGPIFHHLEDPTLV